MLYTLVKETKEGNTPVRVWRNSTTGTETKLSLIYDHKDLGKFWGFADLYKIPIMRMTMVRNITDLYTIGLSLKDIQTWCEEEKKLLKSSDPEKYEKLYALVLEKERIATFTADPIKQQLALCTVYILHDEERIDYFDEAEATKKLQQWKPHQELVAFFLTWHTVHIQRYIKRLGKISQTVLNLQEQQRQMQQSQAGQLKPLEE